MSAQTPESQKVALRPNEIPAIYGIGRTKTFKLIKDGTLKTVKVGHSRFVLRTSLDALFTPAAEAM